jgi:hypothetical protein
MIDTQDTGKLMHLPLDDIQPGEPIDVPEFVIVAAAEALLKAEGRNWIPVIVKQTGKYEYQVVSNTFAYAVAQEAGLERVWCMVTDSKPETIELVKILAREITPKVNLSTASREIIMDALKYLIKRPGSPLSKVDFLVATNRIEESDREEWKDFSEITKLRCGITKGLKLDSLSEIFYLSPPPLPELLPPPPIVSVKKGSKEEIFVNLKYLSDSKIGGFNKIDIQKAADEIFAADKTKWKSLNPISTLDCGITKVKITTLKTVFKL